MTFLDRFLQNWRIRKARPFIPDGARILDIGSVDGVMFRQIPHLAENCLGIDPTLEKVTLGKGFKLILGYFPQDMPSGEVFDTITMLAVLEHFPTDAHHPLATGCATFLKPGGRVIITVPSPFVDEILRVLTVLKLVHGMSLEEHHGYDITQTVEIFSAPNFQLVSHEKFQFGLNHLFVFART